MLYYAFLIFLPLCRGISRTDQDFFIYQNKSFHSSEIIIQELIESALGCANLCTIQPNCCAASFNKVTQSCQLVSSCVPVTLPSESTWMISKTVYKVQSAITDCSDLPVESSGQYEMITFNSNVIQVYCAEGGWMVIQRRIDGNTDFYRNWTEYKQGFGDIAADFYIGNDNLHTILSRKTYTLLIDLEDWTNENRYAEYNTFHVGNEATNYTLSIGDYNGTAESDPMSKQSADSYVQTVMASNIVSVPIEIHAERPVSNFNTFALTPRKTTKRRRSDGNNKNGTKKQRNSPGVLDDKNRHALEDNQCIGVQGKASNKSDMNTIKVVSKQTNSNDLNDLKIMVGNLTDSMNTLRDHLSTRIDSLESNFAKTIEKVVDRKN
ncbi:Hypothetical predicted protein [Mytilus galloprovincialis]|uniref:Fibrinogen C-terminal domain-containing protein n=1 Tax=Mytilus galloprovincialis TaxID=29158 RepID=A0A8B6CB05_MYTGA|nr:Hypothetical predicted protein [Mytilus galloprovincialis]